MNILNFIFAAVIALYAMTNVQGDITILSNKNISTEYSDEYQECECTVTLPRSVVCRSIGSFAYIAIFLLSSVENSYIPPIRRVIVGIKRKPKFRPQQARSVVSDDYYPCIVSLAEV